VAPDRPVLPLSPCVLAAPPSRPAPVPNRNQLWGRCGRNRPLRCGPPRSNQPGWEGREVSAASDRPLGTRRAQTPGGIRTPRPTARSSASPHRDRSGTEQRSPRPGSLAPPAEARPWAGKDRGGAARIAPPGPPVLRRGSGLRVSVPKVFPPPVSAGGFCRFSCSLPSPPASYVPQKLCVLDLQPLTEQWAAQGEPAARMLRTGGHRRSLGAEVCPRESHLNC
jgi:hypothetical protein